MKLSVFLLRREKHIQLSTLDSSLVESQGKKTQSWQILVKGHRGPEQDTLLSQAGEDSEP